MNKDLKYAIWFLAPVLIILCCFFYLPVIGSLYISLTNLDVYSIANWHQAEFIGIKNYLNAFEDQLFLKTIGNTFYYIILAVPLMVAIPLLLAMLLNSPLTRFKNFFRLGYFLPNITDAVAVAVVWRWIFSKDFGVLNWSLSLFGIEGPNWLADVFWAMPAIVGMILWKSLGYSALLYLAGLQSIPEHLYEAAVIDGASRWQQTRHITIPLIRPMIFFITITTVISGFQLFAEPLVMTNGGPLDSTRSMVQYMYQQGFRYFNLGYAAALSYVIFGLIFLATLIQFKFRDQEINY